MTKLNVADIVIPQGKLPRVHTGTVEEVVERYSDAISAGENLPPIKVWKRENGEYWIVDGVHRLLAYKKLGIAEVEVEIMEFPDEINYRKEAIKANIRHGLPLKNEEKRENMRVLYGLGEKNVDELAKLFAVSQKTAYNWLSDLLEKEKQELKRKAIELREQGKTQEEIARELGVPQRTVSDWLRPLAKIVNLQKSLKTLKLDYQAPDDMLLSLLSQYFSERPENEKGIAKFVDWLRGKGYEVSDAEWESFRSGLAKFLESLYVRNLDRSPQERKEALLQGLKAYKKVKERIAEDFMQLVGRTIDREWEAVREVPCSVDVDPQEWIKGRLNESRFLKKHANQVLALLQDEIEKCLSTYPYLTLEEVDLKELMGEKTKEGLKERLRQLYKNRRITQDLVDQIFARLEEERSKSIALVEDFEDQNQEVVEGILEEERLEELFQELLQEEEDKKGLGLKGVLKEFQAVLKGLEKVEELLESGQVEKAKKVVASLKERINKDMKKVETSLQNKSASRDAVRVAYRTAETFRDYYRQWAGTEMTEEDFRKGLKALIRILNKERNPELFREPLKLAVERYFMRKGELEDRYVGKVSLLDFANNLSTYVADTNRMAMYRNAMVVKQQLEELRNGKGY